VRRDLKTQKITNLQFKVVQVRRF